MNFIEVVIKDGNRTVNWSFPEVSTVSDILDKWESGYRKCNRKNIRINDRLLVSDCVDCQLNYFKSFGRKIKIRVESIKKEESETE